MNKEEFRNSLIKAATPAETKLLTALCNDARFKGRVEFQKQIGKYFVDFFITDKRLAIELDGSSHESKKKYDEDRTKELSLMGVRVIRFQNTVVFKHVDQVIRKIFNYTSINKRKNKFGFLADHVNSEWIKKSNKRVKKLVKKGSRVVRRKRNPATDTPVCVKQNKVSTVSGQ